MVVDGLGPGIGNFLSEIGLIVHLELWHHLLDGGSQLLRVKGNTCHVINLALELCLISLHELDGTLDAIVYVDHWKSGLGSEPAFVVLLFKSMEEDLCGIIGCAVEIILFTADHSWVAD